jgi:hypothetical protein
MIIQAITLLAALQVGTAVPDTLPTFEDPRAAELTALARRARATQQVTLTGYSALAQERATAMLRTPGRDRIVYRREMAARVDWQRAGTGTVTLLGAREYVPVPGRGVRVLQNAAQEALDVAFRPDELASEIGVGNFRFGVHPLNPGAEADYRFRSGATSTLILQEGGSVVMHELIVIPRRAVPELVSGSIWIEEGTGRPVQEAYRRAAEIRAGGAVPLLGGIRIDIREIVIEHGLWELQWWLPRVIAIDGIVRVGRASVVPFRYERLYSDYTVAGDAGRAPAPDAEFQPVAPVAPAARWRVVLPEDRAALLVSEFLPASIFDETAAPTGAVALDQLRERLDAIEIPRFQFAGGRAFVELAPLDQVRYNRVEGLSFNVAAGVDIAGVRSFADARIATAGQVLRGQLGIAAATALGEVGFLGFERVHAADPAARPFDAGNSLSAFLLGSDYGEYYAARGFELVREARAGARHPWTLRFFTEQQDSVAMRDPFTLAGIFGSGREWIRAGLPTEPATQHGLVFDLATGGGLGPEQLHWRVLPRFEASVGDFDYGRTSITGSASTPLFTTGIGPFRSGLTAGVEVAAGTSYGAVPGQALWYLGGPATVRGYPPASAAGDGFWRTRVEVGTTFPTLRAVLFSDAGNTWGRGGFDGAHFRMTSAGIGMSFLEGLLRIDLARALEYREGWRMTIAVDNVM